MKGCIPDFLWKEFLSDFGEVSVYSSMSVHWKTTCDLDEPVLVVRNDVHTHKVTTLVGN